MIYLQKTDTEIVIPKQYELSSNLSMSFTNNLGHQEFTMTDLEDTSSYNYFYKFAISVTDMPIGEYNLTVKSGEFPVYNGLVVVGDYKKANTQYDQKHTFIQYGE